MSMLGKEKEEFDNEAGPKVSDLVMAVAAVSVPRLSAPGPSPNSAPKSILLRMLATRLREDERRAITLSPVVGVLVRLAVNVMGSAGVAVQAVHVVSTSVIFAVRALLVAEKSLLSSSLELT